MQADHECLVLTQRACRLWLAPGRVGLPVGLRGSGPCSLPRQPGPESCCGAMTAPPKRQCCCVSVFPPKAALHGSEPLHGQTCYPPAAWEGCRASSTDRGVEVPSVCLGSICLRLERAEHGTCSVCAWGHFYHSVAPPALTEALKCLLFLGSICLTIKSAEHGTCSVCAWTFLPFCCAGCPDRGFEVPCVPG